MFGKRFFICSKNCEIYRGKIVDEIIYTKLYKSIHSVQHLIKFELKNVLQDNYKILPMRDEIHDASDSFEEMLQKIKNGEKQAKIFFTDGEKDNYLHNTVFQFILRTETFDDKKK